VETYDVANLLLRFEGASGVVLLNRSAWGRKGRIFLQLFGTRGSIVYDQERMNEVQLYSADEPAADRQGFRTILAGPQHPPYDKFVPAPGHGLGFNDLKVIECREILRAIAGEPRHLIEFEAGLGIERAVHAAARAHETGRWAEIG
jgi:predicted dehydrogenase